MSRFRYLRASWPFSLSKLGDRLRALSFGAESSDGFRLERVRPSLIEARYFEKSTFEESITDPLGNILSFERTKFNEVEFVLSNKYPQIELINSPRTVGAFISRLSEATNSLLSVEALHVNPLNWAESFEAASEGGTIFSLIEVSNLIIRPNILGRISLAGTEDVRAALKTVVPKGTYSVAKVKVITGGTGKECKLILGSDSTARLSGTITEEIIHRVKTTLPEPVLL